MLARLRALKKRMRRRAGPQPVILMYHRIASLDHDPWGLAVSPEHFAEQLGYLREYRRPIAMDAFVAALDAGELPPDAVAVTFDDGYIDNLHNALPLLEASGIPATLFVVTGGLEHPEHFWWDELARLVLKHSGAVGARIRLGEAEFPLEWGTGVKENGAWRAWEAPTEGRQRAYRALWAALRALPEPNRRDGMARLRELLGEADMSEDRMMSGSELLELAASGTFDVGAHSVSHPALTILPSEERRQEIRQSRRDCEALLGRLIVGFAYPYGDMSREVRNEVAESGFSWACSTEYGSVDPESVDRFALPRIAVGNWDRDALARVLVQA